MAANFSIEHVIDRPMDHCLYQGLQMPSAKTSMLVFGEDWGGHPSSTQHLIRHLSHEYDVTWINSLGLRSPRFSRHDFRRLLHKAKSMSAAQNGHSDVTPFPVKTVKAVPFYGRPWWDAINRQLIRSSLRSETTTESDRLLWTSLPTALPIIGHYREKGVIYYCGDDFSSLAGVDHATVTRMEKKLVARADLVLVASETLAEKFPGQNVHLVAHGVDHALFSTPVARAADFPCHTKVAGFYGSIAEWIDIPLLVEVAKAMPDWHFLFIGPVRVDVGSLLPLSNVTFLGEKRHDELPAYSQYWRASLLPFRNNAQIQACNPLKLREYLAAGAPVVSTPFPALKPYAENVMIAESSNAFVNALRFIEEESLAERTGGQWRRQNSVAGESWAARAQAVDALIKQTFF